MTETLPIAEDNGLLVLDLESAPGFAERRVHERDGAQQMEAMRLLAHAFLERPDTVLQQLVDVAVDLCGADSAGISIRDTDESGKVTYHWVAVAGEYAHFLDAVLPSSPSACGTSLERNRPQLFQVTQRFFDILGVVAAPVTDALLFPWRVDDTCGTVWVLAHGREEAFDAGDARLMQVLADFAAMAVRQQRQHKLLMEKATVAAAAAMANELAHSINNPLQGLTNLVFLAAQGRTGADIQALAIQMSDDLEKLSALVKTLLELPFQSSRSKG